MSAKFGLYQHPPSKKYWQCVPTEEPCEGGGDGYKITWWTADAKDNYKIGTVSHLIVSKLDAIRRIEVKVRGGYKLVSEHKSQKLSSILDWMDD